MCWMVGSELVRQPISLSAAAGRRFPRRSCAIAHLLQPLSQALSDRLPPLEQSMGALRLQNEALEASTQVSHQSVGVAWHAHLMLRCSCHLAEALGGREGGGMGMGAEVGGRVERGKRRIGRHGGVGWVAGAAGQPVAAATAVPGRR